VQFDYLKTDIEHPNTMDLFAYKNGEQIDFIRVFSVGGGRIEFEGSTSAKEPIVYNLSTFKDIKNYCKEKKYRLWQYVDEVEGEYIWDYLATVWKTMRAAVERGIEDEGILPGGLEVQKKAKYLYNMEHIGESAETRENREVCSYAFAVSEQNASGGRIVTAPTCGAAGVLPAVLYYEQLKHGFTDEQILKALATGGLIGNLIKTNASISGAECGCQAEIGTACAMAAAALGELFRLKRGKIEYAAEIAIEHHLGLTCDPICGLVQIPCIERNAVAAMRAINAVNLASFLSDTRKISLDNVIETMRKTGMDIAEEYRETSEGGLATLNI
jgi:L-serine dehydratase